MRPRTAQFADASASCLALGLLSLWGAAAHSLTISPVLVELSPSRRIVSISVANPSERALTLQTQTLAWDQPNGLDHYAPTEDLIVVPPIATVGAGQTQIFRVTMRTLEHAQEQAYRLILEDVTELVAAPAPTAETAAIKIHFNHNLPVFFSGAAKAAPQPRLGRCTSAEPAISPASACLQFNNDGGRYLTIKSLAVNGANLHLQIKVGSRVLAGAWRQWALELPPRFAGTLNATAETSAGPVEFEWQVPGR